MLLGAALLTAPASAQQSPCLAATAAGAPAGASARTAAPTHVAVFNLTDQGTGWRALFFGAQADPTRRVLAALQAAHEAESSPGVRTAWTAYATRAAAAEEKRQEELKWARATADAVEAWAVERHRTSLAAADSGEAVTSAVEAHRALLNDAQIRHREWVRKVEDKAEKDLEGARTDLVKTDTARKAVESAFACVESAKASAEPRFVGGSGDDVLVFSFHGGGPDQRPKLEAKETERLSQLEQDLSTLGKLVLAGAIAGAAREEGTPKGSRTLFLALDRYVLVRKRATLSLSVATAVPPTPADAGATNPAVSPATSTVTTGPRERWFLTAAVSMRRPQDVKFDQATGTLVPTAESPRFLLGASCFLGDLASARSSGPFLSALVEASGDPASSIGVAVGLRLRGLRSFLGELDTFSPFLGWVWVAAEATDKEPHPRRRGQFIAGLTFNLDKVSSWLKK